MKKLEELTREIREKLPRLMELEKGQKIVFLVADVPNSIYTGDIEIIGETATLLTNGDLDVGGYKYNIGKHFEIIGKEPMLNDILQWFKESDMEDGINKMYEIYWNKTSVHILQLWNFEKPYLKDQSHELIKFLHGLINQ